MEKEGIVEESRRKVDVDNYWSQQFNLSKKTLRHILKMD